MVELRLGAVSSLKLIPGSASRALILHGNQFQFLDLVLLVDKLANEFFILLVSMVQRLHKVLPKHFLKLRQ